MGRALEDLAGVNVGMPPIFVRHSDLVRHGSHGFSSECPTCKHGILPMRIIQELDFCLLCGQAFIYVKLWEGMK